MKSAIAIVAATIGLLAASPAMACRSSHSEIHVFLPEMPREIDENAIVLRVRPQQSVTAWNNGVLVDVVEVVRGHWTSATAFIDYGPFTSCSRVHLPAEGALVIGMPREYAPTTLVAHQYRRSDWENDDGN